MPKKHEVIKTKYFKAKDCPADWTLTAEVEMARIEQVGQGSDQKEKLVVYFRRVQQGLVCGAVVWDQFIEATGEEDSDDWQGHTVELYVTETTFGGKLVPAIRVRKPGAKKKLKKAAPTMDDELNDEVAF
ncbi:MAG: hypothetical protein WB689_04060 [Xanthobacteraceae bacterium]